MKHENQKDRQRQGEALFLLGRHLTALGVTQVSLRETPQEAALPYDAQMYVHGMYTGVVEVKCINYRHDEVEGWGTGLMLKKPQLAALRKEFCGMSAVSGKPYWNKEVILLVRCKDDVLYAINLRRVMELWRDLDVVPQEKVKTNHGKEQADFECRYVPLIHWERFE